jgi:hypothetical protein
MSKPYQLKPIHINSSTKSQTKPPAQRRCFRSRLHRWQCRATPGTAAPDCRRSEQNSYTDKKENQIFPICIRKFRRDRLQCHIWLTAHIWLNICAFHHILGSPSSYCIWLCTRSHLNFLIYEVNFVFFVYQCVSYGSYGVCKNIHWQGIHAKF